MMDITKKDIPHILSAIQMCSKSNMLQNHGCVVAVGSKPIATGYNHYRSTFSDGFVKNTCSCHAEIHALRNAVKSVGGCKHSQSSKKRKKVGQRCKLWGFTEEDRVYTTQKT